MEWALDEAGHLDLTPCYMKNDYDMFKVEELARAYYFTELQDLIARDGKEVRGLSDEKKFLHLVCKHGHGNPPLNQLVDLDLSRIERLPVLKAAVSGLLPVDIYRQVSKGKTDKVELVVSGGDKNYVVVLGCVKDYYIVRSAYPANDLYTKKIKRTGDLVESI